MRFQSYFNTAVLIIKSYNGSIPLVHFLKQYFALHKKHGSRDRKLISHLCYCYYRLGHACKELSVEERLKLALFVCNEQVGDWQLLFDQNWLDQWKKGLSERIAFVCTLYTAFAIEAIFPFTTYLSAAVEPVSFSLSHLLQPHLFLRIRPGYATSVKNKLTEAGISFKPIGEVCLALPNGSKTDAVFELDKEVVVQDYSSQRIGELLRVFSRESGVQSSESGVGRPETGGKRSESGVGSKEHPALFVWDCCAASGGKSILMADCFGQMDLVVSDIRKSILENLKERFYKAGIKNYRSCVADLSIPASKGNPKPNIISSQPFDLILCDAPCTGSGTWGRTPESLYFFSQDKIAEYASLQREIISNTIPYLKKGGYFLYSTCSVFTAENEENVAFIQEQFQLTLIRQELFIGYQQQADTLFAALFKKG